MRYRELLELYKKGELAEQEAEKVRTDIERQEAITDYLLEVEEVFDISLPEDFSQERALSDSEDFAKTINSSSSLCHTLYPCFITIQEKSSVRKNTELPSR